MPGPFPGMDPYLERPSRWPGFHQALISFMMDTLNRSLPPHYVATIDERVTIGNRDRSIYPDTMIVRHPRPAPEPAPRDDGGGVAVVAPPQVDPHWSFEALSDAAREGFIEIVPVDDEDRVVTLIEVLSPANKAAGRGRQQYLEKQRAVLGAESHLLEIDLLRRGLHTVAAPVDELARAGTYDYLVSLNRADHRQRFDAWGVTIRRRLPRVAVPLSGDDPDVPLDLQALFDRCYDAGAFARRIDYRIDPDPPIGRDDAEWADALLRERGLRQ